MLLTAKGSVRNRKAESQSFIRHEGTKGHSREACAPGRSPLDSVAARSGFPATPSESKAARLLHFLISVTPSGSDALDDGLSMSDPEGVTEIRSCASRKTHRPQRASESRRVGGRRKQEAIALVRSRIQERQESSSVWQAPQWHARLLLAASRQVGMNRSPR